MIKKMGHKSLIVLDKVIGIFNWNIPRAGWVTKKNFSLRRGKLQAKNIATKMVVQSY